MKQLYRQSLICCVNTAFLYAYKVMRSLYAWLHGPLSGLFGIHVVYCRQLLSASLPLIRALLCISRKSSNCTITFPEFSQRLYYPKHSPATLQIVARFYMDFIQ